MRSPGRERCGAARATASLSSPNLASSERASCCGQPAAGRRTRRAARPRRRSRRAPGRACRSARPGPTQRVPAASGRRAEQRLDERRLAAAVGADERGALAPGQLEVERAERRTLPRRITAPSSRAVTSPERSPPPKRSCSSQRRHGLSTSSRRSSAFSVARTFDGLLLRALRARAADVLVRLVARSWPCARRSPTTGAGGARGPSAGRARWRRSRSAPRRGGRPSPAAPGSPPSRRRTRRRCGRSRRSRARA